MLLQEVYGVYMTISGGEAINREDVRSRYEFSPPLAYGLGRDNKLVTDPRDGVYEVHDCGWACLKLK
jgi:hypothetical protein